MSVASQSAATVALPRGIPLSVRLSPQFVNRLCARLQKSATDHSAMAGLLFGVAGDGLLIVQAFKSFAALDSNGNGFLEGERLSRAFERSAAASQTDPEVSALDLIGWYATRFSGGLHASDIDFHHRHFRRSNDVAVILRPQAEGDALMEFYTRAGIAPLSPDEHRWGALQLATDVPVLGPVEVSMRATVAADELKTFESLDRALERQQRKSSLRYRTRIPLSIIRPTKPIPERERQPETSSGLSLHRIHAGNAPTVPALWSKPKARSPWLSSAVLFASLFAVFAGVTFGFLYLHGLPAGSSVPRFLRAMLPEAGLGLRVQTQGDRVLLSWNRHNSIVRAATIALLHIDDGAEHREVRLDAAQAENGAVLYRPRSNDVTFRLEVRGEQGSTAVDTIRVLDGVKNAPPDVSSNPDAPPAAKTDIASAKPAEHHDWKPVPENEPATPPAAARQPQTSQTASAEQTTVAEPKPDAQRAVDLPAAPAVSTVPRDSIPADFLVSAQGAVPPLAAGSANGAPVSQTSNSANALPLPLPNQKLPEAARDSAGPAANVASNQAQISKPSSEDAALGKRPAESLNVKPVEMRPANSLSGAPVQQAPSASTPAPLGARAVSVSSLDFVPPHPLRQVLPNTNLFSPFFLLSSPQVQVLVKIDKTGHVIDAQLLPGKKVKEALAGAVLSAARQWTFEPAKMHGLTIESEHTIVFQFHPQQ